MKLSENPVYQYGWRTHWRGWWFLLLPGLSVFLLAVGCIVARYVGQGLFGLMSMSMSAQQLSFPIPESAASWFACYTIVAVLMSVGNTFILPGLTAPILTREYETRAFDALRISRLTSAEIVWGKLAAVLMPFGLCFLISLPVSAVAVAKGGAAWWWVAAMYIARVIQLLAFGLLSLLMATWTKRTLYAVIASYALAILVLPILAYVIIQSPLWIMHITGQQQAQLSWKPTPVALWMHAGSILVYALAATGGWYGLKAALDRRD